MASHDVVSIFLILLHAGSVIAAVDALLCARTSQGAIAWGLSLLLFPHAMLPIYLVFGRTRFHGYKVLKRRMSAYHGEAARSRPGRTQESRSALERIADAASVPGNHVELMIDGGAYFDALLRDIAAASSMVWLCFYIVRDDGLGRDLQEALMAAAKRGVKVWFLYDEIGSFLLPQTYVDELRAAGVEMYDFNTRRGIWNFFQINFRNHRKIAIIDRAIAYVGGANVGDEYLGRSSRFGAWRDTQLRLRGPAVRDVEGVFLSDWNWATQQTHQLDSADDESAGEHTVLTVPTGPIDDRETCLLFFQELIRSAERRLWIASPYFVPDEALAQELKLAAVRGVDVRLLLPAKPDRITVGLAALFYLPPLVRAGVKAFHYTKGFLHEKVILVDEAVSAIGSANLDTRSMRLAFEIILAVPGADFACRVERMLEQDLLDCVPVTAATLDAIPFYRRVGANIARLFSPLL